MFTLNIHINNYIHKNKSKYLHQVHQTLISIFYNEYIIRYNSNNNQFFTNVDDISHNTHLLQSLQNLNLINELNIDFNILIQNYKYYIIQHLKKQKNQNDNIEPIIISSPSLLPFSLFDYKHQNVLWYSFLISKHVSFS